MAEYILNQIKQNVGGRPPWYAPPRPASSDTIYVIHVYEYVTITVCPGWPASTSNQCSLVTLTFDLESGVQVTSDVGYLCAKFSLPRPLCSWVMPDVRDRQTSDKSI